MCAASRARLCLPLPPTPTSSAWPPAGQADGKGAVGQVTRGSHNKSSHVLHAGCRYAAIVSEHPLTCALSPLSCCCFLASSPQTSPPPHPPGLVMMRAMRQTCLMASSNSTRSILQPAWSSQRSSSLPVLPIPQEATGHIPAQLAPDQEEGGKQAAAPAPGIGLVVLRQPLQQMGPPRQRGSSWPEHLLPPSSGSCKRPSASHLPPVKGYHAAPVPSRPARPPRSACA